MTTSRRDFLKFVVAGSVTAACPFPHSLRSADAEPSTQIDGDHFAICHEVRDGTDFPKPPVSKRYDVIVVGGGVSGMSAAYFLRDHNFLLLEKEPQFGGNAYREDYQGQGFATGSAFDEKDTESYQLAKELGITLLPIDSHDPSIIRGEYVEDTWHGGLDHLPYPRSVRTAFKKFRATILAMDPDKDAAHLDSFPITDILKSYPPELTQWWDAYGPSNWGARTQDTAALCVVEDLHAFGGGEEDVRVTLPGGNGALARALAAALSAKHADRMLGDATIVSVEPQKSEVNVTYSREGETHTVAAKAVIMATPKFITARLVSGIPEEQAAAMRSFRYCPYPVVNMIFDQAVYNRAYDTWCPGNTFTDFIVADWVLQKNDQAYKQKDNILTFYTPLKEAQRPLLLQDESCQMIAENILHDFRKLQPAFREAEPIEVHFFRRGHPMYLPVPGNFTKRIPLARQPMDRVFFANTDSVGPVSDISAAVVSGHQGADWSVKRMNNAAASAARLAASVGVRS
ncbi:MAG: FAD-dependent oxidoreductase [Candidatus Acidiferrales bacterium]